MPAVKLRGTKHPVVRVNGLRKTVKAAKKVAALDGGDALSQQVNAAKDLGKRLLEAGEFIAAIARSNAAWSDRVPASIRVGGGMSGVVIRAGSGKAPNAYPFEIPGVKHPVFGGPGTSRPGAPWVTNDNRPFLVPAAEQGAEGAAQIVATVIDDWAAEYGFK